MSDIDVVIKLRAEGSKKLAAEISQLGKGFKGLSKELKDTNTTAAKVQNLYGLNKSFHKARTKLKRPKLDLLGLEKKLRLLTIHPRNCLRYSKKKKNSYLNWLTLKLKKKNQA